MGEDDRSSSGAATVTLGPDGHFSDASPAALELLGLSLEQLRGQSPRALLALSDAESEALSATWKSRISRAAAGEATVVRPDGVERRVRFVLTTVTRDCYEVLLQEITRPTPRRLAFYSMTEVLAAWRAAERRLQADLPGSAEWMAASAEVEAFRKQYLRLFESSRRAHEREAPAVALASSSSPRRRTEQ